MRRGGVRLTGMRSFGVAVFVVSLLASFGGGQTALADNRSPANDAEIEAKSLCGSERRGAIWFTNSGNYYGDTVVVEGSDNRTNIPVGIRGSVYSCAQTARVHTGAVNVRADNPAAWRLTNLSGSTLDRGTVSGRNNWSSQGGQIDALLNISGIATNNTGRDDRETISVGIYRCFYNYTIGVQGACYTQIISVTVVRKAKPIVWSLSGSSTVRKGSSASSTRITAAPADRLTWTHVIRNNGPNATNQSIYSNLGMSGFSNGWATGLSAAWIGAPASGSIRTSWSYNVYNVTQNDVGRTLCQWVQYDPINTRGDRNGRGTQACADIPYNYSLNPSVNVPANEVEVGNVISVSARVDNSGLTKSKNTQWQLSYIKIPSGGTIPGAANTTSSPCAYYGVGGRTCTTGSFTAGGGATGTSVFLPPSYIFPGRSATVGDEEVGTQICYALSVKDRSSGSSEWRHSAPDCVVVSKRPVMQVRGGDLLVGRGQATARNIITNSKITGGKKYGSWGEYGIVASGTVTGMASASGYAGGTTTTTLCGVSLLTFSNKTGNSCSDTDIGRYTFKAAASTIASRFPASGGVQISGDRKLGSFASGTTYTNTPAGADINITADNAATNTSTVPKGKTIVINAPGATVKIMSNIRYTTDTLTSIAEIPQVIIIARNIIIADGVGQDKQVSQIDAWLVTTGTGTNGRINTCGAGAVGEGTALTSSLCTNTLTVNGPVIANHLILRRTAGAGKQERSGDPAEVFNLRPDAYLWASNLQSATTKAQTVMTTELPPRY